MRSELAAVSACHTRQAWRESITEVSAGPAWQERGATPFMRSAGWSCCGGLSGGPGICSSEPWSPNLLRLARPCCWGLSGLPLLCPGASRCACWPSDSRLPRLSLCSLSSASALRSRLLSRCRSDCLSLPLSLPPSLSLSLSLSDLWVSEARLPSPVSRSLAWLLGLLERGGDSRRLSRESPLRLLLLSVWALALSLSSLPLHRH